MVVIVVVALVPAAVNVILCLLFGFGLRLRFCATAFYNNNPIIFLVLLLYFLFVLFSYYCCPNSAIEWNTEIVWNNLFSAHGAKRMTVGMLNIWRAISVGKNEDGNGSSGTNICSRINSVRSFKIKVLSNIARPRQVFNFCFCRFMIKAIPTTCLFTTVSITCPYSFDMREIWNYSNNVERSRTFLFVAG